ncbi:hypothetical protein ZIOFF_015707 [Zingiber officinale]|uniref:STI1 domain-containing protein n=1 Tax=Zingiber officinale TaxID=94328 RepID=A0A8J5HJS2_ZINOF|nr:hypothetical protein ZIOFF_015707 [Zingiber officinale]
MEAAKVKELRLFVAQCKKDPAILADPSLSFFRDYLESLGAELPAAAYGLGASSATESFGAIPDLFPSSLEIPTHNVHDLYSLQRAPVVDEIDTDIDEDDVDAKGAPPVDHESDDEIIESDVELEGEIVEADNDPPQKMGDPSLEVTDENRDASQEAKAKAMEAISEGRLDEAIEHLTEAILLNPTSAIMYATRASVFIKMKKPNAAIRDATAALEVIFDTFNCFLLWSVGVVKSRVKVVDCDDRNNGSGSCCSESAGVRGQQIGASTMSQTSGNHQPQPFAQRLITALAVAPGDLQSNCVMSEINPDSAKGYKTRGIALAMLGKWEEAAKDLHVASKLDYDEEINSVLKKVEPNAHKIEEHHRKYERLRKEREEKKLERERQRRRTEAKAAYEKANKKEESSRTAGGTPGGFPGGMPGGMPGGFPGAMPGSVPGNIDMSKILNDPELMAAFSDPEVMAALQEVMSNPASFAKHQANPKVAPIIAKMMGKFAGPK